MNFKNKQKLGHGARSAALIAGVLLVVLLVNVGMTFLSQSQLWYGDLTADAMYTPTEEFMSRVGNVLSEVKNNGQENLEVTITFCADPDMLNANTQLRYIYYTALNLQKAYPNEI